MLTPVMDANCAKPCVVRVTSSRASPHQSTSDSTGNETVKVIDAGRLARNTLNPRGSFAISIRPSALCQDSPPNLNFPVSEPSAPGGRNRTPWVSFTIVWLLRLNPSIRLPSIAQKLSLLLPPTIPQKIPPIWIRPPPSGNDSPQWIDNLLIFFHCFRLLPQ